jgi:hypothetical protein
VNKIPLAAGYILHYIRWMTGNYYILDGVDARHTSYEIRVIIICIRVIFFFKNWAGWVIHFLHFDFFFHFSFFLARVRKYKILIENNNFF